MLTIGIDSVGINAVTVCDDIDGNESEHIGMPHKFLNVIYLFQKNPY